jgi:hypothetical protein
MQELLGAMESVELSRGETLIDGLVTDGLVERRGRLVSLSGDEPG